MKKFLCKIGLHKWDVGHHYLICKRCSKVKQRVDYSFYVSLFFVVVILYALYLLVKYDINNNIKSTENYNESVFAPDIIEDDF